VRDEPAASDYAEKLRLSDFLREPVIRSAIEALQLPPDSRGLDAGCGIGSHTLLLAEAVGAGGHVTGLDLSSDLLAHARRRADESQFGGRVDFRRGDVNSLPFEDAALDWAWSVDCFYGLPRPIAALRELARVVRPGGVIAILGWSSQQLLPGYPLLEARLNATSQGIAPFAEGKKPESHFLRALGWLRDAGLKQTEARTFVGDVRAPLSEDVRDALLSLFEMRWGQPREELSAEDLALFQRLCTPGSSDFILDSPDYYAFFTYSMFWGRVAG
jgi:demethylmenaquinone methyltransferase/2-methoxy-6-polyprenyl-1,4-benzoquinol methylase